MKRDKKNIKIISVNSSILFVFALVWNSLVHLIILKELNDSLAKIHRADINDKMWISLFVTITIVLIFTISYIRYNRNNKLKEAIVHSLFFAIFIAVVVDINQYVLYNIPFKLIAAWMLFGLGEFIIYGLITQRVIKFLGRNMNSILQND